MAQDMVGDTGRTELTDFETLLELQDHDSAADRLRHRRSTLPERATLESLEAEITRLEADMAARREQRDEAARHQKRLEDEVSSIEDKITELDRRLYSGTVSSPRELQALQADVDSIKRHRSSLEDQILEVMEILEPLEAQVSDLEAERTRLDTEASDLRARVAEAEVEIDADLAREQQSRDSLAGGLPPDLMKLYDQLRAKLGGVGVARLAGSSCTGCHLTLPAMEVARIHREPPDALLQCEQCGRILVRVDSIEH